MNLTDKQHATARLVRLGYTNQEIAESTVAAYGTIRIRTQNIYKKLGLRNRVDLAVWYVKTNRAIKE